MKSIHLRLVVRFILVTTLTLSVFGLYAQWLLSKKLEAHFSQLQEAAITRLKLNLSAPLWNYDQQTIESIIEAEMLPLEVRAVYVLKSGEKFIAGVERGQAGLLVRALTLPKTQGIPIIADIPQPPGIDTTDQANGRVIVYFSRDLIDEALHSEILRRVIEVLVIDLLLVLVLTLSLRLVFGPLERLRDALFSLANRESDEIEELPEIRSREFGEVIRGFNLTQRKFKQMMARSSQAEEEARRSAAQTAESMEQLKAAQNEIIKAGKLAALGGIVAGVAHELNTPLGNGLMAISSLRTQSKKFQATMAESGLRRSNLDEFTSTVDEVTDITLRSLERSANLVSSFKQIAIDQSTSQRRTFILHELVHEVLVILQPTLKSLPYTVETVIPDNIQMDSYPGPLEQVLTNFINNAIVHGFDGRDHGLIRIKAEASGEGWLVLTVGDDGKGIAESDIARIFDPFFTTKFGKGGSGLGLHIVHNFVSQILGGCVDVASRPEEGSEFKLILPLTAPNLIENANPATSR